MKGKRALPIRVGWGGVTVGVGEWVMLNIWHFYVAIRVKR